MNLLTREKLQGLLPKGTHHKVTDEVMSLIEGIETDTGLLQDYVEDSIMSYLPVLREIKVDLKSYINAIKYITLKSNMENHKAWQITFPDRYDKLIREGRWNSSHVSMYNTSPLILKLEAQKLLSYKAMYAPVFHQQIAVQAQLASGSDANGNPTSGTVQQLASKTLLEILKPEEETKIDLTIGLDDESKTIQQQLTEQISKATELQMDRLRRGESIEAVQKIGIGAIVEVAIDE